MSNLKFLSWLEFLNTVQGCFQIPQYSFWERVFKSIKWVSSVHACLHYSFTSMSVGRGRWDFNGSTWLYPNMEVSLVSPSLCGQKHLPSQCFCPRYILFILEFLTCGTHFFSSTQHLEGVLNKVMVFQLSGGSLAGSETIFLSFRNLFCFCFFPTPHHSTTSTPDTLGFHTRVRCRREHGPPFRQHWNYWAAIGEVSCLLHQELRNPQVDLGQNPPFGNSSAHLRPIKLYTPGGKVTTFPNSCLCAGPGWTTN